MPDDSGKVTFLQRSAHPFFSEYVRKIKATLPDGRSISSDIIMNFGGETRVYVYWRKREKTGGPYLKLHDGNGTTWVDLARLCLDDTEKPHETISYFDLCPLRSNLEHANWRPVGRILRLRDRLELVPPNLYPMMDEKIAELLWPPLSLPLKNWTFEAVKRSHLDTGRDEYWMLYLRNREGKDIAIYLDRSDGQFISKMLTLYPRNKKRGPILLLGSLTDGILIDLDSRRVYRSTCSFEGTPPPLQEIHCDAISSIEVKITPFAIAPAGMRDIRGEVFHRAWMAAIVERRTIPPSIDVFAEKNGVPLGEFYFTAMTMSAPFKHHNFD